MKKKVTVTLLLTLITPTAFAGGNFGEIAGVFAYSALLMSTEQNSKSYMAADVGSASYSHAVGSDGKTNFHKGQFLRIAYGSRFGQPDSDFSMSAEASYSVLGDTNINYASGGKDTLSGSSLQGVFIFAYQLFPQLDLTGKIGFVNTKMKTTTTVVGASATNGSATDLLYGVGAQYLISPHYLMRVQYDNLGKIDRTVNPAKASALTLGMAYVF